MKPYKCFNGHEFESDDVESYFPKCPTCGASAQPVLVGDDTPDRDNADDNFVQSTVLEDLAAIDSILAEDSVAAASVPDSTGFEGFGGGDSGGAGASDSFDSGSADTTSV